MVYPEAYYAAHKEASSPEELGRIGFALIGRGGELNPPLSGAERFLVQTIMRCNKWHNENREAIKEKWRQDKCRQRKSADVHQCPQDNADNDGHAMSTTSIYLPTDLSTNQSNKIRTVPDTDTVSEAKKLAKSASASVRVKINPYGMSGEEFFSMKYTTMQLCNAALGTGFWAKAIRQIGDAVVLEELWAFICEVKAGELVDNPGAVMTKRLKAKGVK